MAVPRRFGIAPQLDMEQILQEARHRWLRPAEICEILRNYRSFRIAPEPPNRPHSGALFLFDRKILRYFRRDGHSWRKKKDGKTVKEAHERLKVGSVDVLHCYYAHGEENETFQRRSYWLLEEDFMHIVLVHYREVQNTKAFTSRSRESEERSPTPLSSNSVSNTIPMLSQTTNIESPSSVQASEYEDSEHDNHQASSRYHPVVDAGTPNAYFPVPCSIGYPEQPCRSDYDAARVFNRLDPGFDFLASLADPPMMGGTIDHGPSRLQETPNIDGNFQLLGFNESSCVTKPNTGARSSKHPLLKQLSVDICNIENDSGLRKCDSFCKWMSKELEEVDDPQIHLSSSHYWVQVEAENPANDDMFLLSPSLSQDQLFSIVDFSPQWGYAGLETKVLVMGSFLKDKVDLGKCDWSCMFGEVEVPAQVIEDGVLCCHAPLHKPGRVHFYVTCSNRSACSEIREFEYVEIPCSSSEHLLLLRLEKLLSVVVDQSQQPAPGLSGAKLHLSDKVNSLLRDNDNWSEMPSSSKEASGLLLERLLKQKLGAWLLHKIAEDGKGPSVLDEEGQGVLHLASALGYDWAIAPIVAAGVSVDFRDVRGWTALHWAASHGRERTVVALFSLDAAPGALTDPTPEFPAGRTPADLASANGHKGIGGFLAESSLTKHLSILTLKDLGAGSELTSGVEAFEDVERTATKVIDRNMAVGLCAIRKAAQAAARIHQVFRVESFQRKKLSELTADEHALSVISVKSNKSGQTDGPMTAAIRIQNKFRGWKGRREFLIIRQRIIQIQAHVRGHLARKRNANNILWTVGIVEKVILRWRRRGRGLRGFRAQELTDGAAGPDGQESQQDDSDVLKEGREQVKARMDKALARVKSMVQYPEARDQYQRLLTVVEEFQESKVFLERMVNDAGGSDDEETMFHELLGVDEDISAS